jgi:hypothetical protein
MSSSNSLRFLNLVLCDGNWEGKEGPRDILK